jgi:hypothetical protein
MYKGRQYTYRADVSEQLGLHQSFLLYLYDGTPDLMQPTDKCNQGYRDHTQCRAGQAGAQQHTGDDGTEKTAQGSMQCMLAD